MEIIATGMEMIATGTIVTQFIMAMTRTTQMIQRIMELEAPIPTSTRMVLESSNMISQLADQRSTSKCTKVLTTVPLCQTLMRRFAWVETK